MKQIRCCQLLNRFVISLKAGTTFPQMPARKPKIFVFDLDYTLWPFWVDTHVTPPFRKGPNGTIVDAHGSKIKYYPEVPEVLKKLHEEGNTLAVASRTSEIAGANQLLELFGWDKYFSNKQIFPGCKVTHFNNIKKQFSLPFDDMIFFDDESRNIQDINRLGVVSILVKRGVSFEIIEEGLNTYAAHHKSTN